MERIRNTSISAADELGDSNRELIQTIRQVMSVVEEANRLLDMDLPCVALPALNTRISISWKGQN